MIWFSWKITSHAMTMYPNLKLSLNTSTFIFSSQTKQTKVISQLIIKAMLFN